MSGIKSLGRIHSRFVMSRRIRALADNISSLIHEPGSLLDVGCGDGTVAGLLSESIPGLVPQGIDILARPACAIPMQVYDGSTFPFPDHSVDVVLFTDVLHHTPDPLLLLLEASRVARRSIVIKDHLCESPAAARILGFMDWVGNRPHGVVLPYNYWSERQWRDAWDALGLTPAHYLTDLGLYPWFARPVFESGLHFIAQLMPARDSR